PAAPRPLTSFPTRRSSDLLPLMAAHRDDQVAADRELILQSGRHLGATCRHQNGVERRHLRPSHCAVTDPQLDVVVAELTEPAKRDRKSTRLNSSHVAISYA